MSVNIQISTVSLEDVQHWLRNDEVYFDDLPSVQTVDLERDWDALHYLLTGSVAPGRGSIAFIKHGGQDVNHGANERLFHPASVRRIHIALSKLPLKLCRQRFRRFARDEDDIYPGTWEVGEPGLLFDLIKDLKTLIHKAARRGDCLVYSDDA
jgi:hypothetical protein